MAPARTAAALLTVLVLQFLVQSALSETVQQNPDFQACMAAPSNCTSLNIGHYSEGGQNTSLSGTLPSERGTLTELTYLSLAANRLTGVIPSELAALTNLALLDFCENQLSGHIPVEMTSLVRITSMTLFSNRLSGTIPEEMSVLTRLTSVKLFDNHLTGPIPSQLAALTNIVDIRLESNQLSGTIPSALAALTKLKILTVCNNTDLCGDVPANIALTWDASFCDSALVGTHLGSACPPSNSLNGTLSLQQHNLYAKCMVAPAACNSLDIPYGSDGLLLTSTIPSELGTLANLKSLNLAFNQLAGTIPSEIGALTSLTSLDLGGNQLLGTIPSHSAALVNLTSMNLSQNSLTGTIHSEMSMLTRLTSMKLFSNGLRGFIPSELAANTNLVDMYLVSNFLSGTIPSELAALTKLTSIHLGDNQLAGTIPSELYTITNLYEMVVCNNSGICGDVPVGMPLKEDLFVCELATMGTRLGSACLSTTHPHGPPPIEDTPRSWIADMYVDSAIKFDGSNISKSNITYFNKLFRISMAERAKVPLEDVEILSINSSAALVTSRVSFTSINESARIQMASAFSAFLQLHPEGLFNESDHKVFGQALVYSASVGPSGVAWNQSPLLFFPDVMEHPEATQVAFVFEASDADHFSCQLDNKDVECASPYTTPNLLPGNHIFQVTPKNFTSHAVLQPKTVNWTVLPRFQLDLEPAILNMSVVVPHAESVAVALSSVRKVDMLNCSVDWSTSSPGLVSSCEISYTEPPTAVGQSSEGFFNAALTLQVSTANAVGRDHEGGIYTYTIMISDIDTVPSIISRVDLLLNIHVSKQPNLLLYPSTRIRASGKGLANQVVVGETALPEQLQLLSLSKNITEFQITAEHASFGQNRTLEGGILSLSQNRGQLNFFGDATLIDIIFLPAPTQFTGLVTQKLIVSDLSDGSNQNLWIFMMVVAGKISTRSRVFFDVIATSNLQSNSYRTSNHSATVGEPVKFLIHPEDEYGNRLHSGDLFAVQVHKIVSTHSEIETASARVSFTLEGPSFDPVLQLYKGTVSGISEYGQYLIYVALMGSNSNLDGSPLSFQATKVWCSSSMYQVASEAGDVCQCMVGYVPDPAAASNGMVQCTECKLGTYSNAQTDEKCTSCPLTMTTMQHAAVSLSDCVCSSGYFVADDNTQICNACPAGSFSDKANSTQCTPCPQGTVSPPQASSLSQCELCNENFITESPGAQTCMLCSDPNAGTRMNDRSRCWCKENFYADFHTSHLGHNITCKPCPEGGECHSNNVYGKKGYWREGFTKDTFYKCKPGYCLEETSTLSTPCRESHKGVMCSQCSDGYSLQGQYCKLCKDSSRTKRDLIVVIAVLCLILILWISKPLWIVKIISTGRDSQRQNTGTRLEDMSYQAVKVIKINISFYQVVISFIEVYDIPWPPTLYDHIARLQFFQFDLITFPHLCCVYPESSYCDVFHLYLAIPPVLTVIIGILWWLIQACATSSDAKREELFNHSINVWLFVLFLIYPALCSKVLRVFQCVNIYGTEYLAADLEEKCYTADHNFETGWAIVGVIVYLVGIPYLFMHLLWKYRVGFIAEEKAKSLILKRCLYAATNNSEIDIFINNSQTQYISQTIDFTGLEVLVNQLVLRIQYSIPNRDQVHRTEQQTAERSKLIAELLNWAKQKPEGQQLCALPKLGWSKSTAENEPEVQELENRALSAIGSIFEPYQTKCWWYEIFDLGRKLALNGLVIIAEQGSSGQVAWGVSICIFALLVHMHYSPYHNATQNRLSLICLASLACILFVGLLLKVETMTAGRTTSHAMLILLVPLLVLIAVVPMIDAAATLWIMGLEGLNWLFDGVLSCFRSSRQVHPINEDMPPQPSSDPMHGDH